MATVRSVERQIRRVEGFDVRIHYSGPGRERGRDVRGDRQNIPGYTYERRRADHDTVAAWRAERFEAHYPGLTVLVVDAHGDEVPGQTLLGTVRDTYL